MARKSGSSKSTKRDPRSKPVSSNWPELTGFKFPKKKKQNPKGD